MAKLKMSTAIFDLIYPVGSIYITVAAVDPQLLFGGTWERIGVGRTLLSCGGGIRPVGDTNTWEGYGTYDGTDKTTWWGVEERGGEMSHTLALTEAPAHRHSLTLQVHNGGGSKGSVYGITNFTSGWDNFSRSTPGTSGYLRWGMDSQGGGGAHNNIQPYFGVYMWKRIA
jgi:hypothetical protein